MGFAFIREGDTTSHGGRVLACSPENKSDGVPLALLGDKVSCPKCGGIYPIVGVKNLGVTFDGRPVASEGDTTACGATLIRRGHFRLHPVGRLGESDGCITLTSRGQFDKLRAFLKAQPTTQVPGTSFRAYGKVTVK